MLRWWETKKNPRRSALLVVTCMLGATIACGNNSARHGQSSGGSAASSGATTGGGAGAGANAGASSGAAGTRGGEAGAGASGAGTGGDTTAGMSGAAMSGNAGATAALGGAGGSSAGMAGGGTPSGGGNGATSGSESSAGADPGGGGPCIDLCKPDAPACCAEALRCMSPVPTCRIDVLADRVDPQAHYDDLVAKVAALSGDIAVSIGDAEIAKAAVDPEPAARIELDLTAQASSIHGPALKNLMNHPFRVSCDGAELYIGVLYIREGAAALLTPVLHIEDADDGTLRILLGAEEGDWAGFGGFGSDENKERLDRPELRAALCERGILSELAPQP